MVYCGGWKVDGADVCGFTSTLSAGGDSSFIIIDYASLFLGSSYNTVLVAQELQLSLLLISYIMLMDGLKIK